jgi:hypothetical protein
MLPPRPPLLLLPTTVLLLLTPLAAAATLSLLCASPALLLLLAARRRWRWHTGAGAQLRARPVCLPVQGEEKIGCGMCVHEPTPFIVGGCVCAHKTPQRAALARNNTAFTHNTHKPDQAHSNPPVAINLHLL